MNGETTTRNLGILTCLIKQFVAFYKEEKRREEKNISSIKEERYDMAGAIRYINFSGDYENFGEWK